jgi:Protein of unknown function (DUF1549)/Protein of unknown function (DUF1588)
MRPMRQSPMLATLLAAAIPLLAACTKAAPSDLDGSGNGGSSSGGGSPSAGAGVVDDAPKPTKDDTTFLDSLPKNYSEALRTASLKLVRQLPTLAQIKSVAGAKDKKAAYEAEVDKMLEDPRFQERMIKWWKDVMRMGGGANGKAPSRDTAPTFAARIVAEGRPFSDLFTASSGNCPTYDNTTKAFVDGDCKSGAPTESGILTDPGVMYQFYGSMAFRRVRFFQEVFVCTKFPAEYSSTPVHKGSADYTSPWPFESIANAPIDFQDTKSVICANCHTTINHMAPLFGNFDENGAYQKKIAVMTPLAPNAVPTEITHWLQPGETTSWRMTNPAPDLPALGAAIAKDPDVGECAVARMWNFTMSKEDIVSDLATVPAAVLKPYLAEFEGNGQNLKKTLRAMLTSDDFTTF